MPRDPTSNKCDPKAGSRGGWVRGNLCAILHAVAQARHKKGRYIKWLTLKQRGRWYFHDVQLFHTLPAGADH